MRYTQEMRDFIAANVEGKTAKETTEAVNSKFGTEMTVSAMISYKKNHNLKSGTHKGKLRGTPTELYPQNIRDFIAANYKGNGPKKMAELLNSTFQKSYTKEQIKTYYGNNKINSGETGHFKKGYISENQYKFKKGHRISVKTEFKKGEKPLNWVPVGAERIDIDGYTLVKVTDGQKQKDWKMKHQVIWEEHNGPIPEGHVVVFADRNRRNLNINNLILISKNQLLIMNKKQLIQEDIELTKTGAIIAEVYEKIYEKKKKESEAKNDTKRAIRRNKCNA